MIKSSNLETSTSYIAAEELMKTVNIAMTLEKPLLVKGEPGTGKTMPAPTSMMCINISNMEKSARPFSRKTRLCS